MNELTDTVAVDYDALITEYLQCRAALAEIERRVKVHTKPIKDRMAELEGTITIAADAAGLKNVPAKHGTAYWTTHHSCRAANASEFMEHIIKEQAWDLIEKRPSKSAVVSYVNANGVPPPGIDFRSYRAFNVREVPQDG